MQAGGQLVMLSQPTLAVSMLAQPLVALDPSRTCQ
jgi:hypothetical protein